MAGRDLPQGRRVTGPLPTPAGLPVLLRPRGWAGLLIVQLWLFMLPARGATYSLLSLLLVLLALFARPAGGDKGRRALLTHLALALSLPLLFGIGHHLAGDPASLNEVLRLCLRVGLPAFALWRLQAAGWLPLPLVLVLAVTAALAHFGLGVTQALGWSQFPVDGGHGGRWSGGLANPNPFGLTMAAGLLALLVLARRFWPANGKRIALLRAGFAVAALILLAGLALSGSRGAALSLCAAAAAFWLHGLPAGRRRLLALPALVLAIAGAALLAALLRDASSSLRVDALGMALELIAQAPLAGHGVAGWKAAALASGLVVASPHNIWLDLAVSFGLLPVLALLLATAHSLWPAWQRREAGAAVAVAVLVLTAGLFDYALVTSSYYQGLWAVMLALLVQPGGPDGESRA